MAIIRASSTRGLEHTVKSLYAGGIRAIEITMNTPGALKGIEWIKENYPDVLVGAGTVLDSETARVAVISGAEFILTPALKKETIETGNLYGIPVIPGVYTPTEIVTAYEYGAKMVKIFPIHQLGQKYIRDLMGPLPFLQVMAVGGISIENASDFIKAGAASLGIGSSLVDEKLVQQGDFEAIEGRAQSFVQLVNKVVG